MRRGGWWTVALGRWVGILRALVPAAAGASGMPYRGFLTANAAGRRAQGRLLTVSLVDGAALATVVGVHLWLSIRRLRAGHRTSAHVEAS